MKKYLILLCCFFLSCSDKEVVKFDEKLIKKIASEDFSLPSQYNMLYLYAQCENKQISEINVQQLRVLYNKSDKGITFEKYLEVVLNQKQSLQESVDIECFSINAEIEKEYKDIGYKNLIAKYFEKIDDSYRLRKIVGEDKRKTLFYYGFLNNYVATFDDYIGYYYLTKTVNL